MKLFCLNEVRPSHQAGVFIWEHFHPGFRDLGNQASPASRMNTSKFLQRKEWRGEILETEPARLKGLICRFPYYNQDFLINNFEKLPSGFTIKLGDQACSRMSKILFR